MQESFALETRPPPRLRLWLEFALFYLGAPLAMAVLLPPSALFPVLFGFTVLGLGLLHVTEGFHWHDLTRGAGRIAWGAVALFAAATVAVAGTVVTLTAPDQALILVREHPALLAMIALLYPPLSALPQEIVFRPLFFRRYGALLPGLWPAILLNAALFSLAHLMFWNWIVAAMTFSGGIAFAWAYEARRNFPMAVVLHSVAGWIVFAAGLGIFFYSGNIERPF
ncbi:CAAX protease self-immunity [Rhodovulum sp. ES.010]|nr:CAAX protease self-immunity [Rhodovulum sp. ES.010]